VNVPEVLARVMAAGPDAVTMAKGMAMGAWVPYAGKCPLIVASYSFMPDDARMELMATPEEVLRLGADAIAVAIGVRGPNEGTYLRVLARQVTDAAPLGLPVMAHIYPRDFSGEPRVVHDPENVMWALRCGIECGADVIKIPFTGDAASFRDIVATSPVPVVAAGGPRCETLRDALDLMTKVVASGARGATIGRNIWGTDDVGFATRALKAVIHDDVSVEEALARAASK
jgi:class I fructose-bisphosphate aldolase